MKKKDYLVVGLGNPTPEYAFTRHNAGFLFLDALARELSLSLKKSSFSGDFAKIDGDSCTLFLLKPLEYMNQSGKSVLQCASYYRIPPQQILVFHDELKLPFGRFNLKEGKGHGGHNGLRDITQHVGEDYFRLRIGIGSEEPLEEAHKADYVLGSFLPDEKITLLKAAQVFAKTIQHLIEKDWESYLQALKSTTHQSINKR